MDIFQNSLTALILLLMPRLFVRKLYISKYFPALQQLNLTLGT